MRALFRCEMAMVVLPRVASGRVTACSLSVTTHLRVDDIVVVVHVQTGSSLRPRADAEKYHTVITVSNTIQIDCRPTTGLTVSVCVLAFIVV